MSEKSAADMTLDEIREGLRRKVALAKLRRHAMVLTMSLLVDNPDLINNLFPSDDVPHGTMISVDTLGEIVSSAYKRGVLDGLKGSCTS